MNQFEKLKLVQNQFEPEVNLNHNIDHHHYFVNWKGRLIYSIDH